MKHPNVIFIITDDQGYGDVGCHGNPLLQTPNLDQMAREGSQFDNHHHDPLCSPSRSALMTGRYASRDGVWHVTQGRHLLDPQATTMADVFAANGYRTAMFGKWHLGDNYPFAPQYRGFEEVVCHRGGGVGELPDYWGNNYFDDTYFHNGVPTQYKGYCTDVFFAQAIDLVKQEPTLPFFIYLATNAMHSPFIVPEEYAAPYLAQGIPKPRALFYGMIANFDENMGRLFETLHGQGIDDDTLVIFTSDHGTAAGYDPESGDGYNAGMRGKKGSVYDGGHRVPFFMRWPGNLPAGRQIKELTAHIDLLPTLIERCQLETDLASELDGISLIPALKRPILMESDVASHLPRRLSLSKPSLPFDKLRGRERLQSDLVDNEPAIPDRTLFVHLQPDKPVKWHHSVAMKNRWRLINGVELYDISTDPGQEIDVSTQYPEIVAQLRAEYEQWWTDISPAFTTYCYIPIGSPYENPTTLTARDWHPTAGTIPWMQEWIGDEARNANGFWAIEVIQEGRYEIVLRRYPLKAEIPIGATQASLRLGTLDLTQPIAQDAHEVRFELDLKPEKTFLQTWFSQAQFADEPSDQEQGAYYVYIHRQNGHITNEH